MNTIIEFARRLQAALLGPSGSAKRVQPVPARVKLAGRRGYGEDGTPTPKP